MKIVNGKWIDNDSDLSINVFNYEKFVRISCALNCLYGEDITYDRIDIICSLVNANEYKEKYILEILKLKQHVKNISESRSSYLNRIFRFGRE